MSAISESLRSRVSPEIKPKIKEFLTGTTSTETLQRFFVYGAIAAGLATVVPLLALASISGMIVTAEKWVKESSRPHS